MKEFKDFLNFVAKNSEGIDQSNEELGELITVQIHHSFAINYFYDKFGKSSVNYYVKLFRFPIRSFSDGIFLTNYDMYQVRERDVLAFIMVFHDSLKYFHNVIICDPKQGEILDVYENFTANYNSTIEKINEIINSRHPNWVYGYLEN
jgi:hypothetical protein